MVLEWQLTCHVCVLWATVTCLSLLQSTITCNLPEQPLMAWWVEQCSHLLCWSHDPERQCMHTEYEVEAGPTTPSLVLPMYWRAADISQIYNSMEAVPRVLCCSKACMHVVLKIASCFMCGWPFCSSTPIHAPLSCTAFFSTSTGLTDSPHPWGHGLSVRFRIYWPINTYITYYTELLYYYLKLEDIEMYICYVNYNTFQ